MKKTVFLIMIISIAVNKLYGQDYDNKYQIKVGSLLFSSKYTHYLNDSYNHITKADIGYSIGFSNFARIKSPKTDGIYLGYSFEFSQFNSKTTSYYDSSTPMPFYYDSILTRHDKITILSGKIHLMYEGHITDELDFSVGITSELFIISHDIGAFFDFSSWSSFGSVSLFGGGTPEAYPAFNSKNYSGLSFGLFFGTTYYINKDKNLGLELNYSIDYLRKRRVETQKLNKQIISLGFIIKT